MKICYKCCKKLPKWLFYKNGTKYKPNERSALCLICLFRKNKAQNYICEYINKKHVYSEFNFIKWLKINIFTK